MSTSVGAITLDLILNSEEFKTAVSDIAKETANTVKKSTGLDETLQKVGSTTSSVGKTFLGLSAPISAIGVVSSKTALTFEDSMAKVMTIADQTQVSYDDMRQAILDLSDQTGISANEIADNVYNAISAGQETGDAVNFVTESTKLAKAGFADAGASLDILTTILNAYGLEAKEVNNVSDMLIQTQNKGKVTVGELAGAMGKVIPTANANNVALDQLCSGYAIMTANGVACAESTTYMNAMLNELGKSGTKVSEALKSKTGKSFSELMAEGYSLADVLNIVNESAKEQNLAFTDLWGSSEAGKAGLILLGNEGKEFNEMLGEMNSSSGATQKAFETLDTTNYNISKSLNKIKNAGISLGSVLLETLTPVIMSVCDGISSAVSWFNGLDGTLKKVIFAVAGITTALGGGLLIVGKVISGVGNLIKTFKTVKTAISALNFSFTAFNPTVLLVIGAISTLVAIGVALYKNWDTVKEKLSQFVEFWKQGWQVVSDFFKSVWEGIKSFLSMAWEFIKNLFITGFEIVKTIIMGAVEIIKTFIVSAVTFIKDFISGIFELIKTIISTVLTTIQTIFVTIFNAIKTVVVTVVTAIKNTIVTIFNGIKSFISTILNGIKTFISTIFNGIKNTVTTIITATKNTIINIFTAIKTGVTTAVTGVKDAIVNGLNKAFDYIKSIPSKAVTWGKDMIQGLIKGIKSMVGKVGDAVKSVGDKISSFLHFSCPDEGPLSNYETWMPDFMEGLAQGINKNKSLVTNAVKGLSSDMSLNLETPPLKNISPTPVARVQTEQSGMLEKMAGMFEAQNSGDIIIPVYVGNNLIDEIVVKANDRRRLRSGGLA